MEDNGSSWFDYLWGILVLVVLTPIILLYMGVIELPFFKEDENSSLVCTSEYAGGPSDCIDLYDPTVSVDTESDETLGQTDEFIEEPKEDCEIKGNISFTSGEKIYHVPGGDYYEKTEIDESKGEKWFCTEKEAQDEGWRKSEV
jgi:hypothetical protein